MRVPSSLLAYAPKDCLQRQSDPGTGEHGGPVGPPRRGTLRGRLVFQQVPKEPFLQLGLVQRGVSLVTAVVRVHEYLEVSLKYPCLWMAWGGRREESLLERFHVSMKAEVYVAARFHSTFPCN